MKFQVEFGWIAQASHIPTANFGNFFIFAFIFRYGVC